MKTKIVTSHKNELPNALFSGFTMPFKKASISALKKIAGKLTSNKTRTTGKAIDFQRINHFHPMVCK